MSEIFQMKITPERPKAFLDISVAGKPRGRVVIELLEEAAPKAVANFLGFCKGDSLSYKNNYFHRVIKNFIIQAGDIVNCNDVSSYPSDKAGTSNVSIYDDPYEYEETEEPLDAPFKVCAANSGDKNINGSQFFITTFPQPHLSGKHTVFGVVVHGKSVVREVERVATNKDGFPLKDEIVQITDCGEWTEGMDIPIYNASYNQCGGDIYEEYPDDDSTIDKESSESVYKAASLIKDSATILFKEGNKQEALLKYVKCLRYVMEYFPDQDQEPEWFQKYYELKKKLYLNLSLVNLQLKDYKRTIDYSTYLLDMDGVSAQEQGKAYYRRGVAQANSKKIKEAITDLQKAQEHVPTDKVIAQELTRCEGLLELKKKDEKAKYARFFT